MESIKGTRLIVAHRYYELDRDLLWEVVIDDLPKLIPQLEAILITNDFLT